MGLDIEPVTESEQALYLEHLQACFPGWGAEPRFDWVFRRDSGAGLADILFARFDGEVIGGTGVSYRRVMHPNGRETNIGIMTGSWVLPAARGKGCFTAMIEAMNDCSIQRECSLLVAYAFEANPSYRAMARAGLAIVETCYLRDPEEYELDATLASLESLSVGDRSAQIAAATGTAGGSQVRYVYAPEAWREQFLEGEFPIAYLELPGGAMALVEEANGFLRLQALSIPDRSRLGEALGALAQLAESRRHRLFLFSVDRALTEAAESIGCERIPGGYFMKIADQGALCDWTQCDHRPIAEADLVDPEHPAYIGAWDIQNRDRM